MDRRKVLVRIGTVFLTLAAGTAGVAISTGVLGASPSSGVGQLSPVTTSSASTAPAAPTTTRLGNHGGLGERDDQGDDSGAHRRDDDRDGSHEHEYEGADDDD